MSQSSSALLEVLGLKMHFPLYSSGLFRKEIGRTKAVDDVTLRVAPGETLGVVGESGCGKSSLGRTLVRLYDPQGGDIILDGVPITHLGGEALRKARKDFQMIFQDPYSSLNPRMNVFDIIAEPLRNFVHGSQASLAAAVFALMEQVGLSARFVYKYPHEFSGGQRQRIAIARAIAIKPKLVVCDEPVSALDVSIQAQILNLLVQLQAEYTLTMVFIAHDMAAVRHISHNVAVMYLGRIVEQGPTDELFHRPEHPYTKALLSAVPVADPKLERSRQRIWLKSEISSGSQPGPGCGFAPRCPQAQDLCHKQAPVSAPRHGGSGQVACHFL